MKTANHLVTNLSVASWSGFGVLNRVIAGAKQMNCKSAYETPIQTNDQIVIMLNKNANIIVLLANKDFDCSKQCPVKITVMDSRAYTGFTGNKKITHA